MVNNVKRLYVVVYDTSDDKRRKQMVKLLEKIGTRINWSVFECIITQNQCNVLTAEINRIVYPKEDTVVIYPICKDCYSKTVYLPDKRRIVPKKVIVV